MIGLLCFALAVLTSPFKSTLRLEAENAALRHLSVGLRTRTDRHSSHPYHGCCELDEACEVFCSPVVSGGEAAEVFEPAEAAFDAVALLVGCGVVRDDDLAGAV